MSYEPATPPPPPPGPAPVPPPPGPRAAPAELPVRQTGISAGTAFKAGFFGFFGTAVAALLVMTVVICVGTVLSAVLAESLSDLF